MDTFSKDHAVWEILKKDYYTDEGIKIAEEIYDFLNEMTAKVGNDKMKDLYDYWNNYSSETFHILGRLTHED